MIAADLCDGKPLGNANEGATKAVAEGSHGVLYLKAPRITTI